MKILKIILKIILTGIGSFAFVYCLTAFCHADFNFKNWSAADRFITEAIAIIMAIFICGAIITCPFLDKD